MVLGPIIEEYFCPEELVDLAPLDLIGLPGCEDAGLGSTATLLSSFAAVPAIL